jgi:hypothetical protein
MNHSFCHQRRIRTPAITRLPAAPVYTALSWTEFAVLVIHIHFRLSAFQILVWRRVADDTFVTDKQEIIQSFCPIRSIIRRIGRKSRILYHA